MMTQKMFQDLIAHTCLDTLEELRLEKDLAGDSQIKALMLSAKESWQKEAVFLVMQKLREKISSMNVPPNMQATKPLGSHLAEIR